MGGVRSWSRWADEAPVALFRFSLNGRLVAANVPGEALVGGPVRADALAAALEEQHRLVLDGWLQSLAGLDDGTTRRIHLTASDGRVLDVHGLRGSNHITLSVHDVTDYVREHKRLARDLRVDTLTGLANRQAVVEEARRWQIGSRSLGPSTILLLDIDGFKEVNDRFGHLGGDAVLKRVAAELRLLVRETDFLGRFGGEEFLIVLPETTLEGGRTLAEKARKRIEELEIRLDGGETVTLTLSAGVASRADVRGESRIRSRALIAAADEALYAAKNAGRNRVELAAAAR